MTTIRKAQRRKARLRLGISAPSGTGKTLGSLLIAYGIIRATYPHLSDAEIWDKVVLIDTEEGSGELYVGVTKHGITIGEYNYIRISKPYTVPKYLEALRVGEKSGGEVVILDSISHAWAGSGGLLDKQGKIADASKNSYTAWRHVTPEHTAFIDAMLQSPAHIIATMRSKTEYVLEDNAEGKKVPRKIGMAPVQREGMEYEFTVVFDIDFDSVARATKDRTDMFSTVDGAGRLERQQFMITPETGERLLRWLDSGVEAPAVPTLEELAAGMAAEINSVITAPDLGAVFDKHAELMGRMKAEAPETHGYMVQLLDERWEELNPAAPTASPNTNL